MTTINTNGKSPSIQYKNSRRLKPFTFPIAIRKSEQEILTNVRRHDFHIIAVCEDGKSDIPELFYTIGLYYHYQHPELLFKGLYIDAVVDIFSRANAFIKNGGTIQPWSYLPRDITHSPLKAVPIDASNYGTFLRLGNWFYKSLGGGKA